MAIRKGIVHRYRCKVADTHLLPWSSPSGPPIWDAKAAGYEYGLYRALKVRHPSLSLLPIPADQS